MAVIKNFSEEEYSDDKTSQLLNEAAQFQEEVDFKMQLAAKIIKAVRAKGWNNSDFAKEMGINSLSIITKWFSGTHNFEAITLHKIQKKLGISLVNTELTYNVMSIEVVVEASANESGEAVIYDLLAHKQGGYQVQAKMMSN